MNDKMEQFVKWVEESDNIVFFGGAGVSTESGIPDFRSVDGLYHQKYDYPPETILSHSFYMRKPEEFFRFYKNKMLFPKACRPQAADEGEVRVASLLTGNLRRLSPHPSAGGAADTFSPKGRRLLSARSALIRPCGPPSPSGKALVFQIARKPLPTISLLFTIVIKAWSSRPRTCRRSFWAWPRVRTVVSTHFSSWV